MKYTASRLSEGNKVFPAEIHLEEEGIKVRIPGVWGGKEQFIPYGEVSSVSVDSPMVGYSTIKLRAAGTRAVAHGFSKADAQAIEDGVKAGKANRTVTSPINQRTYKPALVKESVAGNLTKELFRESARQQKDVLSFIGRTLTNLFTMGARKKAKALHAELQSATDDIDVLLVQGKQDEAIERIKGLVHDSTHTLEDGTSYRDYWASKRKEYLRKLPQGNS